MLRGSDALPARAHGAHGRPAPGRRPRGDATGVRRPPRRARLAGGPRERRVHPEVAARRQGPGRSHGGAHPLRRRERLRRHRLPPERGGGVPADAARPLGRVGLGHGDPRHPGRWQERLRVRRQRRRRALGRAPLQRHRLQPRLGRELGGEDRPDGDWLVRGAAHPAPRPAVPRAPGAELGDGGEALRLRAQGDGRVGPHPERGRGRGLALRPARQPGRARLACADRAAPLRRGVGAALRSAVVHAGAGLPARDSRRAWT